MSTGKQGQLPNNPMWLFFFFFWVTFLFLLIPMQSLGSIRPGGCHPTEGPSFPLFLLRFQGQGEVCTSQQQEAKPD